MPLSTFMLAKPRGTTLKGGARPTLPSQASPVLSVRREGSALGVCGVVQGQTATAVVSILPSLLVETNERANRVFTTFGRNGNPRIEVS